MEMFMLVLSDWRVIRFFFSFVFFSNYVGLVEEKKNHNRLTCQLLKINMNTYIENVCLIYFPNLIISLHDLNKA